MNASMLSNHREILIATLLARHGTTGVQTHCNTLIQHLDEVNRSSTVVTPFAAPAVLVYPTFAIRRVIDALSGAASVWWYRHWHGYFLSWALRRKLRRRSPRECVIYAQCPVSAQAALDARTDPDQRVIMVVHFNGSHADEWHEKGKIALKGGLARSIRASEKRTLSSLDGIIYLSKYMQRTLERDIPALSFVSSIVIPNFCHQVRIVNPPEVASIDLISIGTLEPRKNQQFLLRVVAVAANSGRRYSLALIGDGPDRMKLEKLARDLGIEKQVKFLGNQPNAAAWLPRARLYVHAATMENMPLAIIEAMRCGLPVVAPPVGGIPEMFIEGQHGRFWSTEDAAGAALLLQTLLDDGQLLQAFASACRTRFESHFSTPSVAHQLIAFLDRGVQR